MLFRRWLLGLIFASLATSGWAEAGFRSLALPPPLVASREIPVEDLLADAQRLLPSGAYLGPLLDARYAVIDHRWLQREFLPFYQNAARDLRTWASRENEASDCDNYGMFLRQMIGLAGLAAHAQEPAAAQVVVVQDRSFSGVRRTREKHSIGLFLTDKGWYVLEPQNGARLTAFKHYANRRTVRYMTFH